MFGYFFMEDFSIFVFLFFTFYEKESVQNHRSARSFLVSAKCNERSNERYDDEDTRDGDECRWQVDEGSNDIIPNLCHIR